MQTITSIGTNEEAVEAAREFLSLKTKVDKHKNRMDSIRRAFIAYMDEHQLTVFNNDGLSVRLSRSTKNVFDGKSFQREHVKLWGKYLKEQKQEQLRITKS